MDTVILVKDFPAHRLETNQMAVTRTLCLLSIWVITLFSPEAYGDEGRYGFVRMPGDEKTVYFFVNGYTDTVAKAEIPNDKWSHLAGVCDGTVVTIYVNGKATHSVKMPESTGAAEPPEAPPQEAPKLDPFESPTDSEPRQPRPGLRPIRHTTAPLCLGSDLRGYAWSGSLDEVVLYRRALSEREVQQLFESASASN